MASFIIRVGIFAMPVSWMKVYAMETLNEWLPAYAGAGGRLAASSRPRFAPIGHAIGLARVRKSARKSPRHHPAT